MDNQNLAPTSPQQLTPQQHSTEPFNTQSQQVTPSDQNQVSGSQIYQAPAPQQPSNQGQQLSSSQPNQQQNTDYQDLDPAWINPAPVPSQSPAAVKQHPQQTLTESTVNPVPAQPVDAPQQMPMQQSYQEPAPTHPDSTQLPAAPVLTSVDQHLQMSPDLSSAHNQTGYSQANMQEVTQELNTYQDPLRPHSVQQPEELSISPGGHEHQPIPISSPETVPMVEVGLEQELDPEVQEYMQRVEKDKLSLDQPVVVHGQQVVQPAHWNNTQPAFQMPVSRQSVLSGLQQKVTSSARWLATWCVRMFKKFQGNVIYTDAPEIPEA